MATNNIFINTVPAERIHERERKDGSRKFYSVSLRVPEHVSESTYLQVTVNTGQVFAGQSAKTKNVMLGAPDKAISCRVMDEEGAYKTVSYTAAEIADFVKEYRANKYAAAETATA